MRKTINFHYWLVKWLYKFFPVLFYRYHNDYSQVRNEAWSKLFLNGNQNV